MVIPAGHSIDAVPSLPVVTDRVCKLMGEDGPEINPVGLSQFASGNKSRG